MITENNYTLDDGFEIIRKRLANAQKDIFLTLKNATAPKPLTILHKKGTYGSHGIKTKKNDYRDYFWIRVKYDNSIYWITLFYNDVDEKSGNFHTQLGRIQFWKNIKGIEKGIGTPNRKDLEGHWYLCPENGSKFNLRIDDATYSAQAVVDKFLAFLELNS